MSTKVRTSHRSVRRGKCTINTIRRLDLHREAVAHTKSINVPDYLKYRMPFHSGLKFREQCYIGFKFERPVQYYYPVYVAHPTVDFYQFSSINVQ